jgi:hypothetical protein
MSWLDLLLFLIVVGTMLWGMFRGAVRQLIGLFGLYLAIVASLWLYPSLAILVGMMMPNLSQSGRETIAFLFLFIFISNVVSATVQFTFVTPPEERKRKKPREEEGIGDAVAKTSERFIFAPLNLLGGMVFALISACVWISLVTAVMGHALVVPWPAYDGVRVFLLEGFVQSRLAPLFEAALSIIYASVSPWVPRTAGELPAIFSGQL